jgi:hypothetical protein
MGKYFRCKHCGKEHLRDVRVKAQQYCGGSQCQQARKNRWEREKLRFNEQYRKKRQEDKSNWRETYPGDQYQREYRIGHKAYEENNRQGQIKRNAKRKIVKTDAIKGKTLIREGLYEIKPQAMGKIVKTDAMIVEIKNWQVKEGENIQRQMRL